PGAGGPVRGRHRELQIRMAIDQPEQLTPGVPAGSGHRDRESHAHEYAHSRKFMQQLFVGRRQPTVERKVMDQPRRVAKPGRLARYRPALRYLVASWGIQMWINRTRRRHAVAAAALSVLAPLAVVAVQHPAGASSLPAGFSDTTVLSGLTNPVVTQFAA